jgi:hypothetical protein
MLNHTHYSEHSLIQGYVIGIGVLFLPTGFLVDSLYRKFFPQETTFKLRHYPILERAKMSGQRS